MIVGIPPIPDLPVWPARLVTRAVEIAALAVGLIVAVLFAGVVAVIGLEGFA